MWIHTNKGFISIVANRNKKDHFLVRARNKEAYDGLFPNNRIKKTPDADYMFRVFCNREDMNNFLLKIAETIDYDNFKNSIKDHEVKNMASKIWNVTFSFQHSRYSSDYYNDANWTTTYRNQPNNKRGYLDEILDDYYSDENETESPSWDDVLNDEEMGQFEEKYGMSLDEYLGYSK